LTNAKEHEREPARVLPRFDWQHSFHLRGYSVLRSPAEIAVESGNDERTMIGECKLTAVSGNNFYRLAETLNE
jgi:hypothetical protein